MIYYDDYKTFILEFNQDQAPENVLKTGVSLLDTNI